MYYKKLGYINSPTRGQNALDLLLTTNEYLIDNISMTDDYSSCVKSDHKDIISGMNLCRKVIIPIKSMVHNYKNCDFDLPPCYFERSSIVRSCQKCK